MSAFFEPSAFPFVSHLEAAFAEIREELQRLPRDAFAESPDSLTTVRDGYDERGWLYLDLFGAVGDMSENRELCPRAVQACELVPRLVNAGLSKLEPGTHLYPHHGEMTGVLRCHLPLMVPSGDVALKIEDEVRTWEPGRCLVFDDTHEHEAWNHGDGDRVVLLVTFARS